MNNKPINIEYHVLKNNDFILNILVDNANEDLSFCLCEFENEMEYLGFKTKFTKTEGKEGFIFDKDVDRDALEREIRRFATHYDIA